MNDDVTPYYYGSAQKLSTLLRKQWHFDTKSANFFEIKYLFIRSKGIITITPNDCSKTIEVDNLWHNSYFRRWPLFRKVSLNVRRLDSSQREIISPPNHKTQTLQIIGKYVKLIDVKSSRYGWFENPIMYSQKCKTKKN